MSAAGCSLPSPGPHPEALSAGQECVHRGQQPGLPVSPALGRRPRQPAGPCSWQAAVTRDGTVSPGSGTQSFRVPGHHGRAPCPSTATPSRKACQPQSEGSEEAWPPALHCPPLCRVASRLPLRAPCTPVQGLVSHTSCPAPHSWCSHGTSHPQPGGRPCRSPYCSLEGAQLQPLGPGPRERWPMKDGGDSGVHFLLTRAVPRPRRDCSALLFCLHGGSPWPGGWSQEAGPPICAQWTALAGGVPAGPGRWHAVSGRPRGGT